MITTLLTAHIVAAMVTLLATFQLGAQALREPRRMSRKLVWSPWLGFGATSGLGIGLLAVTGTGLGRTCVALSGLVLAIGGVEAASWIARRKARAADRHAAALVAASR